MRGGIRSLKELAPRSLGSWRGEGQAPHSFSISLCLLGILSLTPAVDVENYRLLFLKLTKEILALKILKAGGGREKEREEKKYSVSPETFLF